MKIHTGILVDLETYYKVLKKYSSKNNGTSKQSASRSMCLALTDSVQDVQLDTDILEKIKQQSADNYRKRMERRSIAKISRLDKKLSQLRSELEAKIAPQGQGK